MKNKKVKQKSDSNKKLKHGKYFCQAFIRFVSITILSSIFVLFILGFFINQSSKQVLGAQTSIYSSPCSTFDIFCYLRQLLITKRSTNYTIPTNQIDQITSQNNSYDPPVTPQPTLIPGYQLYTDSVYNFSLQYPADWIRSGEVPAYIEDPNGGITPAPTASIELHHSEHLVPFPRTPTAIKSPNGGYIVSEINTPQDRRSVSIYVERNEQNLPLQDYLAKVEVPIAAASDSYPNSQFKDTYRTYPQSYGSNTGIVLEITRSNPKANYTYTKIYGIYFKNNYGVYKFLLSPSFTDPTIVTIMSSFKY